MKKESIKRKALVPQPSSGNIKFSELLDKSKELN